jgi:Ca2+-binding EF-hand superfamily protein
MDENAICEVVAAIDLDKSGGVDFEEFLTIMRKHQTLYEDQNITPDNW